MKIKALTLAVAMIAITSATFAQTKTPEINKRQRNQQERIARGIDSGQLNAKETARLENREAKIQADKKAAKADGVVTKKEKTKLSREENRTSKAIYNQKHDAQKSN